jgi:hypothetical protein
MAVVLCFLHPFPVTECSGAWGFINNIDGITQRSETGLRVHRKSARMMKTGGVLWYKTGHKE